MRFSSDPAKTVCALMFFSRSGSAVTGCPARPAVMPARGARAAQAPEAGVTPPGEVARVSNAG